MLFFSEKQNKIELRSDGKEKNWSSLEDLLIYLQAVIVYAESTYIDRKQAIAAALMEGLKEKLFEELLDYEIVTFEETTSEDLLFHLHEIKEILKN